MFKVLFVYSGNMVLPPPFIKSQRASLINNNIDIDKFEIKGKGIIGYLSNISKLRKLVKEKNYDIIHSHYSLSALLVIISFLNKPIVVSFMGSDVTGSYNKNGNIKTLSKINYLVSKFIQLFVNRIIVKSKNLAEYIYLKNKMSIIPNGVDFDTYKPIPTLECRRKLNLNENSKYILFIGDKNNPRKNFKLLESSLKDLKNNNISLIETDYPISSEKVILLLNATDVLVLTSFFEGSPNIVKEALACNCKVVSVDVGDVKEHINNIPGCYISKYDKLDLCKKIVNSVNFKNKFNSREKISYLEINKISMKIIKIYNSILS